MGVGAEKELYLQVMKKKKGSCPDIAEWMSITGRSQLMRCID